VLNFLFMTGAFKEQETANSNWLPVRENKVPEPRPGSCSQVHLKINRYYPGPLFFSVAQGRF
jgi:hypothetical protein